MWFKNKKSIKPHIPFKYNRITKMFEQIGTKTMQQLPCFTQFKKHFYLREQLDCFGGFHWWKQTNLLLQLMSSKRIHC